MKHSFSVILLLFYVTISYAQESIDSYVNFLKREHLSPKEYVLKLFETADIVILGERDHRDTTQYALILDILADERFIEYVGHIYTEVGVINMTERANALVRGVYSNQEEFNKAFVQYHIDDVWAPLFNINLKLNKFLTQ
jgi:hypothetical protein